MIGAPYIIHFPLPSTTQEQLDSVTGWVDCINNHASILGSIAPDAELEEGETQITSCVTNSIAMYSLGVGIDKASLDFDELCTPPDHDSFQEIQRLKEELKSYTDSSSHRMYMINFGDSTISDHCFTIEQLGAILKIHQSFVGIHPLETNRINLEITIELLKILVNKDLSLEERQRSAEALFGVEGFDFSKNSELRYTSCELTAEIIKAHIEEITAKASHCKHLST